MKNMEMRMDMTGGVMTDLQWFFSSRGWVKWVKQLSDEIPEQL